MKSFIPKTLKYEKTFLPSSNFFSLFLNCAFIPEIQFRALQTIDLSIFKIL